MPGRRRLTAEERKARAKEKARIREKYRTWTPAEQQQIKHSRICAVTRTAKCYEDSSILVSFLDDFREQWLQHFNRRIHFTRSGQKAAARGFVPRSIFYSLIYPKLVKVRYWMRHWGDWGKKQFNFGVVGAISKLNDILDIFGEELLRPRELDDVLPYNTDPSAGDVVGFMCFLDTRRFRFSYDPATQNLRVTFPYKSYRWVNNHGVAML